MMKRAGGSLDAARGRVAPALPAAGVAGADERPGAARQPVEQVARLPEAAGVRLGAEHHDRHLLAGLRQAQERRQAIARAADEAGLAAEHVDVAGLHQLIGAVGADLRSCRARGVRRLAHHAANALVRGGVGDELRHVVGRRDVGRPAGPTDRRSACEVRPRSCAFWFMRSMKPSEPYGETRASARAAALSEPTSSRLSRSSTVTL